MVLNVGGRMFPAPTQLLPESGNGMDGLPVLDSLGQALAGCLPKPDAKLVTTAETWSHRQFRGSTRNLLVGLANALCQMMPENWKLNSSIPADVLKPSGPSCERHPLLQQEIEILSQGKMSLTGRTLHFMWSESVDAITRKVDFYRDPRSFTRLCFSGDEGTEAPW